MSTAINDKTTSARKPARRIAPTPATLTRDDLRRIHQDRFESYYIDDSVKQEPLTSSSTVSPKTTTRTSKKRSAPDQPSDPMEAPTAKKTKSADKATASDSKPVATPTRSSRRITERKEKNREKRQRATVDELPDEQESPLLKKVKTGREQTCLSVKSKGKAPACDTSPTPPPRTRVSGAAKKGKKTKQLDSVHDHSGDEIVVQGPRAKAHESSDSGKAAVIPDDFQGTSSGNGTSATKPEGAVLNEPWHCANRQCSTGMTWHPRDGKGTDGLGRKTISQFFGRNKKETGLIDQDVWHTYCRKDYQRKFYDARKIEKENGTGIFNWHMENIRVQFNRLRLWRPEAKFKVQLNKNMHSRSAEWYKCQRNHPHDPAAAQAEYGKHPRWGIKVRKANKKGTERQLNEEQAFPVSLVDNFDSACCGENFDYKRTDEVLDYIQDLFEKGTITHMPPIEFLINEVQKGEEVTNPKHNYLRWVAHCEEQEYQSVNDEEAEDEGEEIDVTGSSFVDAVGGTDVDEDAENDDGAEVEAEDVVDSIESAPVSETLSFKSINAPPKKIVFKLRPAACDSSG